MLARVSGHDGEKAIGGDLQEEDSWEASEEYSEEEDAGHQAAMMDLIERKNQQQNATVIDWEQMLNVLNNDLPKIPAKYAVEQINPPPYAQPRVLFGKLMPKPEDKEKGGKKAAAKKAAKKDDKPFKPIKWADGPPKYEKNTYHWMVEASQDLAENIFPLNLRGD